MRFANLPRVFGALFFIIVMASCSQENSNIVADKNLIGTWSWMSSSGGIAGTTATPSSTGKEIKLKLTSDGKYFYFTNGVISSQGTYNLDNKNCIHDQTDKKVLIFSNDQSLMIEKIDNSSLLLSDEHYDGFSNLYVSN